MNKEEKEESEQSDSLLHFYVVQRRGPSAPTRDFWGLPFSKGQLPGRHAPPFICFYSFRFLLINITIGTCSSSPNHPPFTPRSRHIRLRLNHRLFINLPCAPPTSARAYLSPSSIDPTRSNAGPASMSFGSIEAEQKLPGIGHVPIA